jgi:GWxTD domain-containing protein
MAVAGCVLLAAVVSSDSLTAQQSIARPPLERLRDSLAGTSDSTTLKQKLKHLRKTDPLIAGVIELRLGELGADPDFSLARKSFRRATRQRPETPEAWYGLGLAEAARSRSEMKERLRLGSRVGLGALERAGDDYVRALKADPRYVPAALELAEVELSLLDTVRLKRARDVLRRSVQALVPDPADLLLAWGRVERSAGSLRIASDAFQRYLASGGSRDLGLLELARTRLALGASAGEAAYYEGAATGDPEVIAGYRSDLEVIAADSNLREFDRLSGRRRAAFLHRFWTDRDHFDLRPEGERLREHYRRLLYARRHFSLTISRRFYGRYDAYRSGNTEVDDRGVIYIRQGEPTDRLRPFIFRAMPNESWRYPRSEGDLLFHFSSGYDENGGGDLYDYRLVESVMDLRGASDAPRDQLILSRQSLSPIYSRMLNWGRYGSAKERTRERNIGAASIAVGTTTDSHELRFHHRLAAVADLIAVGRSVRGALGHLVFAVLARGTRPRPAASGVEYPVRVRLVTLDRHDRSVATLDTSLVVALGRALTPTEYIVGRVEIALPPGHWSYRVALQQGDSGGVLLPRDSVRVSPTGDEALSLSDIALGSPGRAVPWVTDVGDTVLLAPSSLFRERSEIEIYYEASGGMAGRPYRHDIAVFRAGTDDDRESRERPLVALSFQEEAIASTIRSRRTVRLDRLKTGRYLVEVTITDPAGVSQRRRRAIDLIKR